MTRKPGRRSERASQEQRFSETYLPNRQSGEQLVTSCVPLPVGWNYAWNVQHGKFCLHREREALGARKVPVCLTPFSPG